MKNLPAAVLSIVLLSCGNAGEAYLKHTEAYTKISEDCSRQQDVFKLTGNTIGERYEFQACLDAGGNIACNVTNRNDSVNVNFTKTGGAQALYKVILDINTQPDYHFITINGSTYVVNLTR